MSLKEVLLLLIDLDLSLAADFGVLLALEDLRRILFCVGRGDNVSLEGSVSEIKEALPALLEGTRYDEKSLLAGFGDLLRELLRVALEWTLYDACFGLSLRELLRSNFNGA